MAQPMLKPSEVRTAPAADGSGNTVTVEYVAGGSFTKVQVNDPNGKRVTSTIHQWDSAALRQFDELTTVKTDEMEA